MGTKSLHGHGIRMVAFGGVDGNRSAQLFIGGTILLLAAAKVDERWDVGWTIQFTGSLLILSALGYSRDDISMVWPARPGPLEQIERLQLSARGVWLVDRFSVLGSAAPACSSFGYSGCPSGHSTYARGKRCPIM